MFDLEEKEQQNFDDREDVSTYHSETEHELTEFSFTGFFEPDLCFTQLVRARFNGRNSQEPSWNSFFREAHDIVLDNGVSVEEMSKLPIYRELPGRKDGEEGQIILRGMSANGTWKMLKRIARMIDASVEVEFIWRENAAKQLRNKSAVLKWRPTR